MANMFALILVIATVITGLLWCLDKFIFAPKRRERQAAAQAATGDSLDKQTLKKVGPKTGLAGNGSLGISGAGDRPGGALIYL
ncbi:Signal peptidase I [Raoultella ornithinolytica]|nr:Signal peptidase I [Raoultella ornithinolytica]